MIVYGMYAAGDTHCRYVGVTTNLERRLAEHKASPNSTEMQNWLLSLGDGVEIRAFRFYHGRKQSYYFESKKIIEMFLSGHDLFNKRGARTAEFLLRDRLDWFVCDKKQRSRYQAIIDQTEATHLQVYRRLAGKGMYEKMLEWRAGQRLAA